MIHRNSFVLAIVSITAFTFSGCNSQPRGLQNSTPATQSNAPTDHDHADHAHHDNGGETDMDKMTAELANLSPEDRASADKQHFCPVSGEMLGTMGAPKKIDVNGQQVWICCDSCKDQLLANPDAYLAKLNKG